MWWMDAAKGAMALAGDVNERYQAKAARTIDKSNAKVQNILRVANNELAGAQGALARYQQSRQNQIHLMNSGRAVDAITTNMARLDESARNASASRRIAASEEMGALAARMGASGMGGSTTQMLNATAALRYDMVDQMAEYEVKQQTYDMGLYKDVAREQMILGLRDVRFNDNINYMETQHSNIQVPSMASVVTNASMTFMKSYAAMGGGSKTAKPPTPVVDKGIPASRSK